jgi:hypothetical protein
VEKPTILPPSPPPEGATGRTPTLAAPAEASAAESTTNEAPATLAAAEDEPLFATETAGNTAAGSTEPPAVATEGLPDSSGVPPSTTQESHV